MSHSVTIYIANSASPTNNEDGTRGHSITGHMWFSLNDDSTGAKYCYGFHPAEDGDMRSPIGRVKTNDNATYPSPWFKTTFQISDDEYENLMQYCESTRINHTFGPYWGIGNSCINYTMNVMSSIRYGDFCDYPSPIPIANTTMLSIATSNYNSMLEREAREAERKAREVERKEAERQTFPTQQQYSTQPNPFGFIS
ncbi:hypothetical protein [Pelosinus baikalensis]|uniref:Uncharacterized protein n=1 Tax=Pelosinus baikalensis TaxID=2892015 RepID=A0ABS8HYH9_9FIRM|nr:hypothetical protein [Pelosinus baikalensis]MCC5468215.1 hypothetical protein [Pelosinus baikalensis]